MLQAGIDIGGNVPEIILQCGIIAFQRNLNLTNRVKNGGMISGEFLTDIREAEIGQLSNQIDSDLTGFVCTFVFQCATEYRLVNGIELADLADDQAGRGKGIALALEHIGDGPGDRKSVV